MITQIRGRITEKNPAYIVIETAGGVSYFLHISLNTFSQIKEESEIRLYTHYVVKEDAHILYGFYEESERTLFRLLISVNGIGPNTACLILSALSVNDVANAIASEDVRTLQSVKGIGAKTAQRAVIELKDKMAKASFTVTGSAPSAASTEKSDALNALVALGFPKNAADKVLDKIIQNGNASLSVEELIKKALKML
ncbi:MAG: Holliday junction branch migration protein RuvA [Bacteroidales bacterium]|nr:Holliday junction branch migration protein RuvA [Bacteroidales bacterium]